MPICMLLSSYTPVNTAPTAGQAGPWMQDAAVQTAHLTSTTQDAAVQTVQVTTNEAGVLTVSSTSEAVVQTSHLTSEAGVQTVSLTSDAAVLTNSLPNYISAIDSITEIQDIDFPIMDPTVIVQPNHYTVHEVGIQTTNSSLHHLFLRWFQEQFSLSSSEMDTMFQEVRVQDWVDNLEGAAPVSSASTILSDFNNADSFPFDSISCGSTNASSILEVINPIENQAVIGINPVPDVLMTADFITTIIVGGHGRPALDSMAFGLF